MTAGMLLLLTVFPSPPALVGQFEGIARNARGRVGSAVMLIETGEIIGFHANERFPMQSVFKLPIAMAALFEVERGKLSLDQKIPVEKSDLVPRGNHSPIRDQHPEGGFEMTVRELLRVMMVDGDGTACDVLLRLAGGPAATTERRRAWGVKEMIVATSEKAMSRGPKVQYRNWATPQGALGLLRVLQQGSFLSRSHCELLLQFMAGSATGPRRIKGLLPAGTVVSHKTGSSGTVRGLTRATNDIGIVSLSDGRHLAIAVFVSDSRADEAARDKVIAETARAAWEHYGGRPGIIPARHIPPKPCLSQPFRKHR
jgi:beta-lactamase class A